jgi:hypothetical protein
MKILKTIEENENEGLMSLIGQRVTFYCLDYIYCGDLIGVNDVQIKLQNCKIVYDTGAFEKTTWETAEKFPNDWFIRLSAVTSYGVLKND